MHEAVKWVAEVALPRSPRLVHHVGQWCPNLHVGSPLRLPLNAGPEEPGEITVLEVLRSVNACAPPEIPKVALPVHTSQAKTYQPRAWVPRPMCELDGGYELQQQLRVDHVLVRGHNPVPTTAGERCLLVGLGAMQKWLDRTPEPCIPQDI